MARSMRQTAKWLLILLVTISAAACRDQPARTDSSSEQAPPPPPPSAADILADLERENAAGKPQAALKHAQTLISQHAGTPEADRATQLLPELEAAVEAAAEAERVRAAEAAAAAEARRLALKWSYRSSEDPMTSRPSRSAVIQSENTVNFDFPYQGPQHGTLQIRDHPTYGSDVILTIERGQFLCQSYTDCQIRVRFDESSAQRWNAVGPADNSSTAIFLRNQAGFRQRLRSAKVVRIQAAIYQEGEPTFEFHVAGIDYDRFRGKQ